ncbi:hypothetical protein THOG05_110014 [Vibrio rotiferianus]|nr:hypothetical protein THOG05_110014 [Vibrio rotiferianus]CAH1552331.1 hypothetical protein THOE12_120183 [Vibrio rotiferianus]
MAGFRFDVYQCFICEFAQKSITLIQINRYSMSMLMGGNQESFVRVR